MKITSDSTTYKDVRFTRQLAFLALGGSVFYFIFDSYNEAYPYLIIYLILVIGSFLTLYLVKRNILLAKGVLLSSAYFTITCFASVEILETGIYYYYILLAIAALALYGYRNRLLAFAFIAISILLFFFIFFTDVNLISGIDLTPTYIRNSLLINFILILTTTILIIYYLLQNNFLTETALNNQRENLIKATSELEESQRRFELAIQGSSAAIWDWDIKNNLISITPKLADILGRPLEQLHGATKEQFLNIIHPNDVKNFELKLENHFNYRENFEIECRLRAADGKYVWVLASGQAEWDSNYNPIRMVGTIVDINDKKLAVERVKEQNMMLAKTNEELDRFVYSTSHDLRAPLSSLLGLINIAGSSSNEQERNDLIKMMKSQIIKLDSYIQDITDYSRNERVEIVKEHFSLCEVINEAIQNLRFMEGADTIDLINKIKEDSKIYFDKGRFKIIVNNLISNAIKYQDPDKKSFLKISMKSNTGSDLIYFEDNGLGIEKSHQEKVFNMFYRASDRSRGSGLGLYIAGEIASKTGIDLTLESEYGRGSVFIMRIPHEEAILG